ncbi:MAG: hypothetical protein HC841_01730 [Verrucomicrobiae bacterium]|nr:hypothetical protein [Verrucomicrobiae bacterium]
MPASAKEEKELSNLCGEGPIGNKGSSAFVRNLDPLARIRRRAADHSMRLDKRRRSLLLWMIWLIYGAGVFLVPSSTGTTGRRNWPMNPRHTSF